MGGRNLLPASLRAGGWGPQRFPLTEVESLDSAHRASWSGVGGLPPKEDWGATLGDQGLLGVGGHERPLIQCKGTQGEAVCNVGAPQDPRKLPEDSRLKRLPHPASGSPTESWKHVLALAPHSPPTEVRTRSIVVPARGREAGADTRHKVATLQPAEPGEGVRVQFSGEGCLCRLHLAGAAALTLLSAQTIIFVANSSTS